MWFEKWLGPKLKEAGPIGHCLLIGDIGQILFYPARYIFFGKTASVQAQCHDASRHINRQNDLLSGRDSVRNFPRLSEM